VDRPRHPPGPTAICGLPASEPRTDQTPHRAGQDVAALTLARDLPDLRLAQLFAVQLWWVWREWSVTQRRQNTSLS
jgi:hypothetical protein